MQIRLSALIEAVFLFILSIAAVVSMGISVAYFILMSIGALLTARLALRTLYIPQNLNSFSFFRLSIMIGYLLGPFLSMIYWLYNPNILTVALAGPFAFHGYQNYLSKSLGIVYFSVACLTIIDGMAKPITKLSRFNREFIYSRTDKWLIIGFFAIVSISVINNDLGYMGPISTRGEITILGSIGALILPAIISILAYGLANPYESQINRVFYALLLVPSFITLFIMGRRYLIFATFIALIFTGLSRPGFRRVFKLSRLPANPKKTFITTIVIVFVICGMYAFYAIRIATWQLGEQSSLIDRVTLAFSVISGGDEGFYDKTSDQSFARPGTLPGYLGRLEKFPHQTKLDGQCLIYNLIATVPRVLLPGKNNILSDHLCTDESVNAHFGLPVVDSPTTILTRGYADFSYVGAIIYLIFIATLFQIAGRVTIKAYPMAFRLFALAVIFNAAIFVESDISSYFVAIRNLALIAAIIISLRLSFAFITRGPYRRTRTRTDFEVGK